MIKVGKLYRRYGDFTAVDNVSFSISQGEIVGLLGHNGAGKTTIMKMLTGYLEPSSGSITVGGFNIESQVNDAQNLIGYLPENLPVYPEMLVIDYLFYCAKVRNIPEHAVNARVKSAIEKTQLEEKAFQPISTLSRGFKQRVGVAQSLIHSPKLLILDEPTNGLDPYQTAQMRTLIKDLSQEATIILSTHIMQEVDAICDRALILDSGKLAIDQTLETLRSSGTLELKTSANIEVITALAQQNHLTADLKDTKNNINTFILPIQPNDDAHEKCAILAEQIVQSGHKVFALHPLHQDLETVFRSVYEKKAEVRDAN